jgi:cytochrome P450
MAKKVEQELGGCPVLHTDYRVDRPVMSHYPMLDADREAARFHWNDSTERGFWAFNRHEDVLEACQNPDLFSNSQVNAFEPTLPDRYFLPNMLDQPDHSKYRRILNPFFSPAAVKRLEPLCRERAASLVDEVYPSGGCEFVNDFAIRYPTELFLALLGLPVSDGPAFIPWVEAIFLGIFDTSEPSVRRAAQAQASIVAYFADAVEDRSRHPRDPDIDVVSRLLRAQIDGVPMPREDILNICFTLMIAGLDTTRSSLGYIHYYLADHPDVRADLVANPDLWPKAIEEFIRVYGLIIEGGRIVTRDTDFHGLPLKRGDAVWLGFAAASRDPRKFPEPERFDPNRPNLTHQLGFGAGIHRCIGMHLARAEMTIALQAWHARIPDYRIATSDTIIERGGQLSILRLPLEWDT